MIPAWKHIFKSDPYAGTTDPALITNPMSRLSGFYAEGLDDMCHERINLHENLHTSR